VENTSSAADTCGCRWIALDLGTRTKLVPNQVGWKSLPLVQRSIDPDLVV
jgi:hypothetical protein